MLYGVQHDSHGLKVSVFQSQLELVDARWVSSEDLKSI